MKVKDAAIQAFPFIEPNADDAIKAYHPGITLRDYFAAKAMQGEIAANEGLFKNEELQHQVAKLSYEMADAMLEARK